MLGQLTETGLNISLEYSYTQHYIFLQGLMCPHHVSEISHFQHFVMASNGMFGLTFCKISLYVFLSVHDTCMSLRILSNFDIADFPIRILLLISFVHMLFCIYLKSRRVDHRHCLWLWEEIQKSISSDQQKR